MRHCNAKECERDMGDICCKDCPKRAYCMSFCDRVHYKDVCPAFREDEKEWNKTD